MPDDIRIHPVTPDRAQDWVTLFGPKGACYDCWCLHFRLAPKVRQEMTGAAKRDLMVRRIEDGPPPGLIAYRGDVPIGWMQIGPRADVPEWNNPRRAMSPLPDTDPADRTVWAISCFFFVSRERGQGLSHRMVAEGLKFARTSGAKLVEASPMDRSKTSKSIGLYVGSTAVFEKAGFTEVARQKPGRPLMRKLL